MYFKVYGSTSFVSTCIFLMSMFYVPINRLYTGHCKCLFEFSAHFCWVLIVFLDL